MSSFSLSEDKALVFHRAILGLIGDHPNLISRALAELERLRTLKPQQTELWDRWAALLDCSFEKMSNLVLADTPDGGLLRANSPFLDALSKTERNSVWQRIGLMQFIRYFLDAVDDLALELSEQAAITGITIEELTAWQTQAPQVISNEYLSRLKQVVALQKALMSVNPDQQTRRNWLRRESKTLSGIPLSLLMDGKWKYVLENLTGVSQLTVSPDNMPRMGNS